MTRNLPRRFWCEARSGTQRLTPYNRPLLTLGLVMSSLALDDGSFLLLGMLIAGTTLMISAHT